MTCPFPQDPEEWWHADRHGVHGPESELLTSSLACSVETARRIPRALAESLSAWCRDEGRSLSAIPAIFHAPKGALRSRLARIRRSFASYGLQIRRSRGRRWWFAFPADRSSIPSPVASALLSSGSSVPDPGSFLPSDLELMPRAEESLRLALAGKRRVTRAIALAAIIIGIRDGLVEDIPF